MFAMCVAAASGRHHKSTLRSSLGNCDVFDLSASGPSPRLVRTRVLAAENMTPHYPEERTCKSSTAGDATPATARNFGPSEETEWAWGFRMGPAEGAPRWQPSTRRRPGSRRRACPKRRGKRRRRRPPPTYSLAARMTLERTAAPENIMTLAHV